MSGAEPNNWEKRKGPEIETSAEGDKKQKGRGGRYRTRGAHGCASGLHEPNKQGKKLRSSHTKTFWWPLLHSVEYWTTINEDQVEFHHTNSTPSAHTLTHEKNNSGSQSKQHGISDPMRHTWPNGDSTASAVRTLDTCRLRHQKTSSAFAQDPENSGSIAPFCVGHAKPTDRHTVCTWMSVWDSR